MVIYINGWKMLETDGVLHMIYYGDYNPNAWNEKWVGNDYTLYIICRLYNDRHVHKQIYTF